MFIKEKNYYKLKEFEELGLRALFTTQEAGCLSPYTTSEGLPNLTNFITSVDEGAKTLVWAKQTHSDNIVALREDISDYYDDVDGFITQRKDILIATFYADCLPIYAYDKKNSVIGLCHSGWAGTHKQIGIKMVEAMKKEYGSRTEDITIAFGIGISLENYEVSRDFRENFRREFKEELISASFEEKGGKLYFDNQAFNYHLLKEYGIKDIITNDFCTYSNRDFHSYRRDRERAGRSCALLTFSK